MSSEPARPAADLEHRRWLIGIGISVAFGLFGAVMAWLSYSAKTTPQAPAIVHVNAPPGGDEAQSKRRHKSGHDRD